MRKSIIVFAGVIAAGTVSAQSAALGQADAQAKLTAAGYQSVRHLEMDDGFWEADARRADGNWIDVRVHPVSGKVYAEGTAANLDAAAITAKLAAAGYIDVHDVELDDGVWIVEARNREGAKVDLAVDPEDGAVLSERRDD